MVGAYSETWVPPRHMITVLEPSVLRRGSPAGPGAANAGVRRATLSVIVNGT
jgi:hypothetical protein